MCIATDTHSHKEIGSAMNRKFSSDQLGRPALPSTASTQVNPLAPEHLRFLFYFIFFPSSLNLTIPNTERGRWDPNTTSPSKAPATSPPGPHQHPPWSWVLSHPAGASGPEAALPWRSASRGGWLGQVAPPGTSVPKKAATTLVAG